MNQVLSVLLSLVLSAFILTSLTVLSAVIVLGVRGMVSDPQVGLPILVGVWMALAWFLHLMVVPKD